MQSDIPFEAILNQARLAPSGDNLQPWRVKILGGRELGVYKHYPEDFLEPDYFFSGPYTGAGAFIEAIVVVARHFGYSVRMTYPGRIDATMELLARLTFTEESHPGLRTDNEKLYTALSDRRTDRRKYSRKSLEREVCAQLEHCVQEAGGRLTLISNRRVMRVLARLLSKHDDFFWEDDELRDNLIRTIHFTKRTDAVVELGMPAETLGLGWKTPFLGISFRIASQFPWLWKVVALQSKQVSEMLVRHAGAMALITLPQPRSHVIPEPGYDFRDDIDGGRIMMRLWLQATALGLVVQPAYALVAHLQNEGNTRIKGRFLQLNQEVCQGLRKLFPDLAQETLVFAFRLGYPRHPQIAPSSPRKSLQEVFSEG